MRATTWAIGLLACTSVFIGGCASNRPKMDYAAFRQAQPHSILVLPPLNETPDVGASLSLYSTVTLPLAESGYYVMPVTLVNETFRQNGLANPPEMHAVAPAKLREIFGADTALYIKVTKYGSTYTVLNSAAVVSADARLVDLRTGNALWTGSATATNDSNNNSGGGIAGLLVAAVIKQIVNSTTDASHTVAVQTSTLLLSAGRPNGLLYGPRSPKFGQDNLN
jgi:hypothetical protein